MSQDFPFEHFFQTSTDQTDLSGKAPMDPSSLLEENPESNSKANDDSDSQTSQLDGEIHGQIKSRIPHEKYSAFFETTFRLSSIDPDGLVFEVPTQFIKIMIEGHYLDMLKDIVYDLMGRSYELLFNVGQFNTSQSSNKNNILNGLKDNLQETTKSAPKTVKDARFTLDLTPTKDDLISKIESTYINHVRPQNSGIAIDPKKTFDNFIVGPSNNMAYAMAKAVAEGPNRPNKRGKYPSLYIYSHSGLGKTHLLHAIANTIKDNNPTLVVAMITAQDFVNELIDAINTKTQQKFQQRYRETIDVLIIDDIQELKGKPSTQDEFFHVFNAIYNNGKQLVFTSDKMPKEIDGLPERILTRLEWGLVIDIQKPDFETRMAILKNKALELDLYVPEEALALIASSIKNSIRELEGALMKLSAFADVLQTDIDIEMVKENLSLTTNDRSSEISIDSIARSCSLFYKIPLPDIRSKSRSNEITKVRHIAMYLSKKTLDCTFDEIGQYYGGRHHSTIMHAVKEIAELLEKDAQLTKEIQTIEVSL